MIEVSIWEGFGIAMIRRLRYRRWHPALLLVMAMAAPAAGQYACPTGVPDAARDQAIEIGKGIFIADGRPWGSAHTGMVRTREGPVIIDVSRRETAPDHRALLSEVDDRSPPYVILTHGHADHRSGIDTWRDPGTEIVAQKEYVEFRNYQERLSPFLDRRFSPQVEAFTSPEPAAGNYGAPREATVLFDDSLVFALGDLTFEVFHTPAETYDGASVWIPELGAAFVGDAYYGSFPNLYTIRGTRPRWALDWVESLNRILSWEPELLVFGHGSCIAGRESIRATLTRYRDAILHVHDATVAGMNAGRDRFALMREVELPEDIRLPETYGRVSWSVRGIYEGYVGWYDGHVESLFPMDPTEIYSDLVELAGGARPVVERARAVLEEDDPVRALRLTQAALRVDPESVDALMVRSAALSDLIESSDNRLERRWLSAELSRVRDRLGTARAMP